MLLSFILAAAMPIPPSDLQIQPGAVAIFVAGQSNGVGRGIQTAADLVPEPDVFAVKSDGQVYPGADPFSSTVGSGVGFSRTLARGVIDAGRAPQVFIVNCAIGSTPAHAWAVAPLMSRDFHRATEKALQSRIGSWLYIDCAMAAQIVQRLGVEPIAVAWHQGETGCATLGATQTRAADLTIVRDRFKADYPGIVFVGGELARTNRCRYLAETNAATEAVSDGYVASDGLTVNVGDTLHFDRASQQELGRRYATKILELLPPIN